MAAPRVAPAVKALSRAVDQFSGAQADGADALGD